MKQQANEKKNKDRRRVLQDDSIGRCGQLVGPDEEADGRGVAHHGNQQRDANAPTSPPDKKEKEKRGKEAAVKDDG